MPMKTLLTLFACATVFCSCSTINKSVDAKDPARNKYDTHTGDERGGAQFETVIWSNDPGQKTLPKALGADGKEK